MNTRLLIHAGVQRTGTSAVQIAFRDNVAIVAQHRVHYPLGSQQYLAPGADDPSLTVNHQRLAWDLHKKKVDLPALRLWCERLLSSGADTIVISGEDFCILKDLTFLDV